MLKIKLVRIGKKKQPSFNIVVAEAKSKLNGRYLDSLGLYNPLPKPHIIKIDKKKYQKWLERGAQPTQKLRSLVRKMLYKDKQKI